MTNVKRFIAFVLAAIMMFSCVSAVSYAGDTENTAEITIKMGKMVEGVWTETTEVNPGDDVVARVFLGTNFPCGTGTFAFFYDKSFYTDNYTSYQDLSINPIYNSCHFEGELVSSSSIGTTYGNNLNQRMINCVGAETLTLYNWVFVTYDAYGCYNMLYDGDDYLFDIDLQVKDSASGTGFVTILPGAVASPTNQRGPLDINWGDDSQYMGAGGLHLANSTDVKVVVCPEPDSDHETSGGYMTIIGDEERVDITTKFFREDDDGNWVETTKVKQGEDVKARVYIAANYATDSGELVFFYNNKFFEHSYGEGDSLVLNSKNDSYPVLKNITDETCTFSTDSSTQAQKRINKMVTKDGYSIPDDCGYFYVTYYQDDASAAKPFDDSSRLTDGLVENDYWFCEFDLTVKETAAGEGDLFADAGAAATTTKVWGVINVPKGVEDTAAESQAMYVWNRDATNAVNVFSNPVSVENTITFDANGGEFDNGEDIYEKTDLVGTTFTADDIEVPDKTGSVFICWYLEDDATQTPVSDFEIGYEEGVTYLAKWSNEVTVTFMDGEEEVDTLTGGAGTALTVPDAPNKESEGKTFVGWTQTEGGLEPEDVPSTFPDADRTYYTIYDMDGAVLTLKVVKDDSVAFTTTVDMLVGASVPAFNASSVGYTVPYGYEYDGNGWYKNEGCTEANDVTTMPVGGLTLYAKVVPGKYDAVFKLEGGNIDGDTDDVTVSTEFSKKIDAPDDPVKAGYTFTGWTPDVGVMDTKGKTFTATWEKGTYTVEYYLDADDIGDASKRYDKHSYEYDEEIDPVADPYKEGYTFEGWTWYKSTDTSTSITAPSDMPAYNLVVVANWTIRTHKVTVHYVYENDTVAHADNVEENVEYGETYSITSPTITGYTADQTVVTGSMPDDDVEVTVVYTINTHTLTVIYQYENGEEAKPTYTDDFEYKEVYTVNVPEITGYTPKKDGVVTEVLEDVMPDRDVTATIVYYINTYTLTINYIYADDNSQAETPYTEDLEYNKTYSVTSPSIEGYEPDISIVAGTMPGGNVDVTVKYEKVRPGLTIHYIYEDGETAHTDYINETLEYEDTYSVDIPEITGYTAKVGGVEKTKVEGTMGTEAVVVTVTYYANPHTITWIIDGAAVKTDSLKFGESVTAYDPGTREGYSFSGWSPDTIPQTMPDEDLEYTGSWQIQSYTLTIKYQYANGEEAKPDYTETIEYNKGYSQSSPEITGYTPDKPVVSGNMPAENTTIIVTYAIDSYSIKVTYVVPAGFTAPAAVDEEHDYGYEYSYTSPTVTGCTPDKVKVEGTLTGNVNETVTYTVNSYSVKVTYVVPTGFTAPAAVDETHDYGYEYSYTSPAVTGCAPDHPTVTGTVTGDVDETVTYSVQDYTLTIKYQYENGNEASADYTETVTFGEDYSHDSPSITGYVPNIATVSGTMNEEGKTVIVTYSKVKPGLTIHYIYEDGETALPDYNDETLEYQDAYSVDIPELTGYTPKIDEENKDKVDGIMGADAVVVTVTYYANPHTITWIIDSAAVKTDSLKFGEDVTAYDPGTKEGYSFSGWSPDTIPQTMPDEDLTFVGTWIAQKYDLTIHYVYADNTEAKPDYTEQVEFEKTYSVESPSITGYTPDQATVAGTMNDVNGIEVTVTYNPNSYTLTINYVYENDEEAAPTHTESVDFGKDYSVESPSITGYTPDQATVAGTMDEEGKTITVTYTANVHILVIHYKYADNTEAKPDYSEEIEYDREYAVSSPSIEGYTANPLTVTGRMGDNDQEITVTYTPEKYALVIDYVMSDGTTAPPQYRYDIDYNSNYSVSSPEMTGYTPDISVVTGTMGLGGAMATVTYTPNDCSLTIKYKFEGTGEKAAEDYSAAVKYNAGYSVDSPAVKGYAPDIQTVTGTMDNVNGKEITVTYSAQDYTLTIKYQYENGDEASADYTETVTFGGNYSHTSPAITGYEPDIAAVTGTMDEEGKTIVVTYTKVKPGLTIHYVYEAGGAANPDYRDETLVYGDTYTIVSPTISGYTPDIATVTGIMGTDAVVVTVTYTANPHTITWIIDGTTVKTDNVKFGDSITEYPYGSKEGYTFSGWSPAIPGTVPDNDLEFSGNWVANTHKLTINYVITEGPGTAPVQYNETVAYGTPYSVTSPAVDGYTPSSAVVSGTMPDSDVTETVTYEINSYPLTVEFVYGDGPDAGTSAATAYTGTVKYGDGYSVSSPAVEGYTPDVGNTEGVMGTSPVTKTVTYTRNEYSLEYQFTNAKTTVDSVEYEDSYTTLVKYGDTVPSIPDPVHNEAGYTFVGWQWYRIPVSGEHASPAKFDEDFSVPAGAVPITGEPVFQPAYRLLAIALWKDPVEVSFFLDFENDSVGLYDLQRGKIGDSISRPSPDPTKEGYTFAGWYVVNDNGTIGAGPITNFGTFEEDVVKRFTAVWDEITCYAKFYANGGTWVSGTDPHVVAGRKTTDITAPTDLKRTGYSLSGWSNAADSVTPVDLGKFDAETEASAPEFYAIWVANKVTFKGNGGYAPGDVDAVTVDGFDEGDDISSMVPVFTNGDYVFNGWIDEATNTPVVDPNRMPSGEHVYIAQWKSPGAFNVIYKVDGVEVHRDSFDYGAATTPYTYTKTGYTISDWDVSLPAVMPAYDIERNATSTVNKHTVTFDPNGGDWAGETAPKTAEYAYGSQVSAYAAPAQEGVVFAGWVNESNNPVSFPFSMPDKDLTFRANWVNGEYFVHYLNPDGTEFAVVSVSYGSEIKLIDSTPEKEGYNFYKWEWHEGSATGKRLGGKPAKMPASDLYAIPKFSEVATYSHSFGTLTAVGPSTRVFGGEYTGGNFKANPTLPAPLYVPEFVIPEKTKDDDSGVAKIPHTGSSEGLAVFAIVSAAAASAFLVLSAKKKEDEE